MLRKFVTLGTLLLVVFVLVKSFNFFNFMLHTHVENRNHYFIKEVDFFIYLPDQAKRLIKQGQSRNQSFNVEN